MEAQDARGVYTEECIKCKKMFDCKGKPDINITCLHFEKRDDINDK